MMRFDAAPWAPRLKAASAAAVGLLAVVAALLWATLPHGATAPGAIPKFLVAVPPIAIGAALLFVVRGFALEGDRLEVRRLLWSTSIPLRGLERAWHDPQAMQRSIRVLGNGGLFAISGLFRNRALGTYRAFVTRPDCAVVLRLPSRVVVISPAQPRAFLHALAARYPDAAGAAPGTPTRSDASGPMP